MTESENRLMNACPDRDKSFENPSEIFRLFLEATQGAKVPGPVVRPLPKSLQGLKVR